jgi:hypothetical protein
VLEKDVKKSLKEYLTKLGCYQYWPVPMGYGASTIDVLFCYQGRFYGVETKRPGVDKPTAAQDCVMGDIAHAGGGVCLENSPELPKVRRMLGFDVL